jgi:hypothetical protein
MRCFAALLLLAPLAAAGDKLDSPIIEYHSINRAVRDFERQVEDQEKARAAMGAADRDGLATEQVAAPEIAPDVESDVEPEYAESAAFNLEVDVGVWYAKLSGPVRVDGDAILDAGVGSQAYASPTARVTMTWHDFVVIIDASFSEFSSEQQVTGEIPLQDGGTFPVDTTVRTRFQFSLPQILLGHHFRAGSRTEFRVLGGVALYNISGRIWNDDHGGIKFDQLVPLPLIGFEVRGHFGNTRFVWEIFLVGFGLNVSVLGGQTTDFRASLGYRLSRNAFLRFGYRHTDITVQLNEIDIGVVLDGPEFELEVRF